MCVVTVPLGIPARLTCALAVGWLLGQRTALAFTVTDPSNPSIVTNAPEPTESDLRHQLQMHSGFGAAAAGGGWTFVPAISGEEIWTDNILNTNTNRRWDLLTIVTPSIAITGDTPNAQVLFEYGPQLRLAARTPQENSITNQLLANSLFTIVPDEFYVSASAIAGGTPVNGGYGALGTGVTPNFGGFGTSTTTLNSLGTTGLSNANQVQVSSVSISPYWLHRFGDTGTAKIGYQLSESSFSQGNSYVPVFFPIGHNAVTDISNLGYAQFDTGDRFEPFQNHTEANAQIGSGTGFEGNSEQYWALDKLTYVVNREISVFGELGYENLQWAGTPSTHITDAIWGFGTTWTPNPDSQITVSVIHRYGDTNWELDGSYALSARTHISASYTTGVQTNLQGIQNQLNLTTVNSSGQTVNSVTGAPVSIGTNGVGVQAGVFRVKAFTANVTTTLDRDQLSAWLQISENTTISTVAPNAIVQFNITAPPVGSTTQSKTVYASWTHQIRDDWTLGSVASFSTSHTSGSGNQQSLAASVGMQYLISQTLAATLSYSFFDRLVATSSQTATNQSYYQNLVLVGLTKQF